MVRAALQSLRRLVRRQAARVLRRLDLLPSGVPDGIGENPLEPDSRITAEVLVYFPDTVDALYQMEHWYSALRALDGVHRTAIVVQDSRVAAAVTRRSGLDVLTVTHLATMDTLLDRSDVRVALYVNHSPLNFQLLRFPSLAHVSLLHGDSDKTISVSNQTKAYDFVFVAGQAAIDRARRNIPLFDTSRMLPVGRPNLDADRMEEAAAARSGPAGAPTDVLSGVTAGVLSGVTAGVPAAASPARATVVYAPTWEGAQVTASYGSVASHGESIVRTLIDGGYRVVYRPHPLTGVRLAAVGEADRRIRAVINTANLADPAARHRVDLDVPVLHSFDQADLLICDISAISVEWLPTGRPMLITVPTGSQVVAAETELDRIATRLTVTDLDSLLPMVRREIGEDPSGARRRDLVRYYVGDTSPGEAVRAFVAATGEVIERHRREWARVQSNRDAGR